jgi:SSS family solute:Na+ symporter
MFWERCTVTGAMAAAIGSAVFSWVFWWSWPSLAFMDRVGLVFVLCLILAVVLSLLQPQRDPAMRVELRQIDYSTGVGFNLAALVVTAALIGIYWIWW